MPNLTPYQLEALDHSKHISLTANAGSGKTFVLARRFLSILIEENISLSNVVAITFTEKAAAELYKKIATELESRINTSIVKSERSKLNSIRRQLVSAKISTIHSFCADLLKEFSPEAGIDANFTPIDKNRSDELITTTIEELTSEIIKSKNEFWEDYKKSIRLFGSKDIVSKHLKKMIDNRSTLLKLSESLYDKKSKNIANYISETFVEYFEKIFKDRIELIIIEVKSINDAILNADKNSEIAADVEELLSKSNSSDIYSSIIKLNEILGSILTNEKIRTRKYLSKNLREEFSVSVESIESYAEEFKPFDFSEDYEESHKELAIIGMSLFSLWFEVLEKYEEKKRQFGYLDFEDLLLVTQELLKSKEVLHALSERYKYFMIDEYQDTNETQYNIFIPILDYLRRGNLFVVGDEKQSIYMFRGADLEIFNKTKKDIQQSADEQSLLKLPHSFRLSPELTLLTNRIFSQLFINPNSIFNEVEYDELVCARKDSENSKVEFLISEIGDENSSEESEMIAKKILEITSDKSTDFKDIAILSRKRKSFSKIEESLINYKIPYLIYGGKGFYQRQEIYDLHNYLSFLVNPSNDAALIGILRSPFFCLSDLELYNISNVDAQVYFEKLKEKSLRDSKLTKICDLLKTHIQLSKSLQISLLIHQILIDTGYWAIVSSKTNSEQYISNIEKLITSANNFESQGLKTLFDFVNYLEDAINSAEDESQASLLSNENAVKLMTIHASKGLEFPTVFLVDMNSRGMDDRVKSKDLAIDKNFGLLTKTQSHGNYFDEYVSPPIVCMYNYISQKKALAELKRLLYVGVTRAQNSLYISSEIKRKKNGDFTPEKTSLLALLMEGLRLDDLGDDFRIEGNVRFMMEEDGKYLTKNENISLPISLKKEIGLESGKIEKESNISPEDVVISSKRIDDTIKNEIISATKIAVFNQCPFKYYLIYEIGFSGLHSLTSTQPITDLSREDSDEIAANVKGTIVHKILEEETSIDQLRIRISQLLEKFDNNLSEDERRKSSDTIYKLLSNYYSSQIYKEIQNYSKYENEFEIYSKVDDYFIFGIIDKVIFDGKKVRIYDYKTDSLVSSSIETKMENYKSQLTFYALLIKKLYDDVEEIECNLIVLEDLNQVPKFSLSKDEMQNIEKRLKKIIINIRNEQFTKNTSHCKSCYFSDSKNQCVAENLIKTK